MYHVFKWNKRRVALQLVTKKGLSRWDDADVPAFWKTKSAATAWAKVHIGSRDGIRDWEVKGCLGRFCGLGSCPGRNGEAE